MTDFISDNIEQAAKLAKKYGIILMVVMLTWYTVRQSWFWLTLPALGLICAGGVYESLGKEVPLNLLHVVCGWVFIFSLGKALFGGKK